MKKIILLFLCFAIANAKATVWNVNVTNAQFTPSTLNVVVGDVIHWALTDGSTHTTTSITVPSGAATWSSPITSGNPTFNYTVTVSGNYTYYCTVHGVSMSGSFTASAALPITLSSFNIAELNNKAVLKWTTDMELNSSYFSIRKSLDGITFKEIAKVTAAGNSNTEKKYSYTDEKTSAAKFVYYSLGITDKDGKVQLSPIKIYKNKLATAKLILSLSPNPISSMGHLMLKFNAENKGVMIAKLYDEQGKIVLTSSLSAEKGINNGHIHLGNIAAGNYTISFALENIKESYKITKK